MDDFAAQLSTRLRARAPCPLPAHGTRPAAVLVPLYRDLGQWHLLLTQRTHTVESHKGQVAFPGGHVEKGDVDRSETALREAEEEIGLRRADVILLGELDELITVTHYHVTPVVGVFQWPYPLRLFPAEVAVTFSVPLSWLAAPVNSTIRALAQTGSEPPRQVKVFDYPPYTIWGVTAQIILNLLDLARPLLLSAK